MRLLVLAAAVISMGVSSSAFAQTPPAAPTAPSTAPATASPAAPPADGGKRIACRQSVTSKGLRGQDARDQMTLCMAEGQVDCVKQAISQKVVGPQRKDFLKTCMGRKVGGDRS